MNILQAIITMIMIIAPVFTTKIIREMATTCTTPLNESGLCISLKYCPEVVNIFGRLPHYQARQYSELLKGICGGRSTADNYPVVCCTHPAVDAIEYVTVRGPMTTTTTTASPRWRPDTTTSIIDGILANNNDNVDDASTRLSLENETGPACFGPDARPGSCKPLENCAELFGRLLNDSTNEDYKRFLRSSNRVCANAARTAVCCPRSVTTPPTTTKRTPTPTPTPQRQTRNRNTDAEDTPKRLPTEEDGCGFVRNIMTKVIGGEDTQIGAWPWIALIGYNKYSLRPFKCGGSLITAKHVITAAHCLRSDLSFVRLGEHDLSIEYETNYIDVDVIRVNRHPDYGQDGRHDLAILLLERTIEFTDAVRPICLPTSRDLITKSYVNSNPFVAGWGRTTEDGGSSNVLQQLQLPVLNNSVCYDVYKKNARLKNQEQFDDSVLCAGYLEGGRDSCKGDSGGPLMIPEPYKGITHYYLIGIVSYGIGCAQIGIPGVYTSVQHFIPWIEETIAK